MSGGEKPGLVAALQALDARGELPAAAEQAELWEEAAAELPLRPARSPKGGRPQGARNRATREWMEFFLARYRSPLVGLAEVYSRPARQLAEELGCDLLEAGKLQLAAMQALLPYVHQKQPMAIEAAGKTRGLLILGDLGSLEGAGGELALPLAPLEQNQQVIEHEAPKSDVGKSDDQASG